VAILKPVILAGTQVQRASLHNFDELAEKEVQIGDFVDVHKAAEIIPEVLRVNLKKRPKKTTVVNPPEKCPICNAPTHRREGEVALRCSAPKTCPAQRANRFEHWVSRQAMDIDGVGPALMEKLIANNMIDTPADLYKLTVDDFLKLDQIKDKSAQNAFDSIQASKDRPLARLLNALGMPHVGKETAVLLANTFYSMDALTQATDETLVAIDGIGPKVAESIITYLNDPDTILLIKNLKAVGVRLADEKPNIKVNETHPFFGKTFVLTGTLPSLSRQQAEDKIRAVGGKITSSVSKKTSYVLLGESPGSKAAKAEKLGVPAISEAELLSQL
jgi:DNA ligase (NAD+)